MSDDYEQRFDQLPRQTLPGGFSVVEAASHSARRRGLSRLDALAPDHALHIPKCFAVHTFGMRFALDLIWLAKDGTVVRVDSAVGPRRMKACFRARSVVETLAGEGEKFIAAGLAARP